MRGKGLSPYLYLFCGSNGIRNYIVSKISTPIIYKLKNSMSEVLHSLSHPKVGQRVNLVIELRILTNGQM